MVAPALASEVPSYPQTRRDDTVDTLHGTLVPDPYRWLEQDPRTSDEVAAWIRDENAITFGYLEAIPQREAIRERLTELWNYERYSSPFKVGERYLYFKNDGLQNQSVLYTTDSLGGEARVVLDPNSWSEDGTVALTGLSFSDDGRYMAYARSSAGSDWQEWFVRDLESGQDMADRLQWTKFTGTSWTPDGRGFFYSRFPEVKEGAEFQSLNTHQKLYYHRVGTRQADDVLVYHRPDQPEWGYASTVSEDGRYLVISVWKGTDPKNRVLYKDLDEPYGMPVEIIGAFDNEYSFLGNDGSRFYFKTDRDAPNGRVIVIDVRKPEPENWTEILPEEPEPLESVGITGNLLVARYLKDVVNRVRMFRLDGTHVRDVDLPGIGTVSGFGGKRSDMETFYTYSSFNRPASIYRYDMITGKSDLWQQPDVDFDPEDYTVKQVFYNSKDGTRVPMFIAHRKGIELDGNNPTLLYGYGGFGISMKPGFSVTRLAWMEMGGVYAQANLRGGGEYGEDWHDAGKLQNKQNVFDDFIAAAEWLIDNDYTTSDRLAIQGGSNGGLLVGACLTQRPDLFGATLPAVGVMDMLRYHKFTAGRYWVDDYGSPEDPEMFRTLLDYSPYHNIKPGTEYPATLITTADTDDRVIPAHSFKFAAALQHAQDGSEPVLIRIETSAGHGGGKPTAKRIEEAADLWAFLVRNLDVALDATGPSSPGRR
ncbi:MAG: prolyl oligopeptidase family serine peptidase [Acidobacteriota bacterium]